MARKLAVLPKGARITDFISLGVIAKTFPPEKIREVLEATGRASVRQRALPAHVMMYFVVALALYMQSSARGGVAVSAGGPEVDGLPGHPDPRGRGRGHLAGPVAAGLPAGASLA